MKFYRIKQHSVLPALLALGLLGGMPTAQAGLVLDLNTGGAPTPCGGCGAVTGQTFGWGFTVLNSITVDGLGVWDAGSDGIGASLPTGLWTSGGTLLASATLSDADTPVASASSDGRWLFETIAPITLSPGNYLIGAVFFSILPPAQVGAPFVTSPDISGISGKVNPGGTDSGFQAPTDNFGGPIFGPTLRQVTAAVPEPASLALFAIGGLGLAARRRAS